jgi:hypothetical protein
MEVTDTANTFSPIYQITRRQIHKIVILIPPSIRTPRHIFFTRLLHYRMTSKFSVTYLILNKG